MTCNKNKSIFIATSLRRPTASNATPSGLRDVKPLQMEIRETQKLIEDRLWEGDPCESLQTHLDHLYELDLKGEKWYCNF